MLTTNIWAHSKIGAYFQHRVPESPYCVRQSELPLKKPRNSRDIFFQTFPLPGTMAAVAGSCSSSSSRSHENASRRTHKVDGSDTYPPAQGLSTRSVVANCEADIVRWECRICCCCTYDCVFVPGEFLSSRVTGDLIMRGNMRATTTTGRV